MLHATPVLNISVHKAKAARQQKENEINHAVLLIVNTHDEGSRVCILPGELNQKKTNRL